MPLEFQCSACGKRIRAAGADAGKRARCPACRAELRLPVSTPPPLRAPGGRRQVIIAVALGAALVAASILALVTANKGAGEPEKPQAKEGQRDASPESPPQDLPVEVDIVPHGSRLLIRVLYDRLVPEQVAARYCDWRLRTVDMKGFAREFYRESGPLCTKVVVEVFTAREPYDYLKHARLPERRHAEDPVWTLVLRHRCVLGG